MASWKEKGEVPDSDDEWDIESQRNEQDGGVHEPELENTAEIDDENAIETENEERIPSQDGAEQSQELLPQDTSANDEASPPEAYEAASTPTNEVDAPLPQIWSSPDLARVFKIPDLEGLSDEEDALRIDARRAQMPATDDISRSYVRITSPLSTQPSSPPGSLPELPPLPRTKSGTTSTLDSLDIETAPPEEHIYESNGQDVETGSNYPMKRSLRQRNAIQLHPYVVEQEKYRRTLKSRGIAPMRLASSQIEPRHAPRKSSSPDPDFQEQETQEVEGDTGESQAMELDWDPPPSSSPVQPVGNQNQNVIDNEDEDEDKKDDNLPDIDELLRSRQQPSGKPDLKRRRIKSYSHKFKRPVLPRILTQPRAPRTTDNGNPIFDVPASPPATSSPFPNPVAHGRVGASRGEPRSLEPTPSLLSQEDIYVQRSVDLPTPATSAIKPPLEPISLTSESESDDPFASDVENSLASSSSDESVQIRKISKKIRGVLPASHLRLDQKNKPQPLSRTNRDSRSASPARMMPRRGVALPRTQSGTLGQQRSLSAATSTGFSFFSDDEDDENDEDGLIMENNPASQLESLFPESRMGFAEEEDKIDAMLPSRKRQSTTSSRPSKKRKTRSSSFLRTGSGTHRRQPKIIDHLGKALKPSSGMKLKSHRPKGKGRKNAAGPRKPSPPALGILDVTDVFPDRQGTSPDFIRIAARAARARTAQGRHKPAGKFFRLSTREDTEDVQSVLQDWTAGKLQPRNLSEISKHKTQAIRGPLSHIHNNQQTRFDPSISKARPAMQVNPLESSRKVRRLLVSRRQQSMSDFVRKDPTPQDPIRLSVQSQPSHNIDLGAQRRPRFQHHSARPAQLEGSENDYSHRYPSTTFKSSKIALDALYRGTHKRPIPSANLQLSRFLADEDVVRPSIENRSSAECDVLEEAADNTSKRQRARKVGRQKQQPRLVDVGAAAYRQPTDPLILDCFATEAAADASDSKLQGLAKFGTRYTQNFDILPLPPGVFFHASTFVGSGRLSEILRDLRAQRLSPTPIVVSLNLAKTFSWGPWDENVSSEVGLCFDWLVDQLELDSSLPSSCLATAVMDVVMSVLEYMQQSLTFSGPLNETMFLSRMLEVLRDFCSRLRVNHITSHADVQKGVQVLSRICTLTFRLLCVARAKQEYAALSFEFENVLKSTAYKCSQLLLSQDLSVLRKLYDDLQYLSFRDGGIRRDQYAAEAWVILIQVLAAAKISRGSFWDVVGPVLTTADVARTIDAPTMEKMWYSMYTLLPLCEFDEHGVIIQGARRLASFDNWQLPQQMLKRIFSLYKSNPRQSPGFNEYCRSIVSRCHYLMVEWGWWKCSAVIGTLFDFFASQKLAHLRNEEVYTSPHFLEEFDQNPTLAVEPEDRCFHIFLKIVALALKQFSHVGDVKSIRNLVARLLPNHDRQYPKDEAIHQKDLASLRNHHDLLCTMFWASTSAQRPSLATIENLVERGRSHKEAFLVHIRAHANLTRFAFSSNQEMEVYTRLNDWQEKDVSSLIDVHRNAELEIRNQAEEGTTEAQISEIVSSNKIQIEAQIFALLAVWALNIGVTLSLHHAITVLNAHALAKTISFARTNDRVLGLSINFKVLHQCLTIIDAYAEKVEEFRPEAQQQEGSTEDSQDSIGEVVEYMANRILPLREKSEIPSLYDFLALLARDCLAQEPEGDEEITLTHLVRTWARVVMLFVGTATPDVEKYVIFGRFAVFENREKYKTAKKYWPFFLANLLRHSNDLDYFRIPSFNLELQWLLVLIDPHAVKSFEIDLTNQMVAKGSYLCKSIDTDKASAVVKFKGAVSTMNAILTRSSSQSTNNLPFENAGPVFSDMIRSVETAMQKNLISMEPGSREHKEYLSKVQDVIAHTKAFGRTFWRPSLFFSERSAHYWPDEADPHQFGPTLISYCLRLETEPEKASSEMFFFLYYQWETHVKSHNIKAYIHHLRECTKYWSLVRFMLADLIPVTLQASFKTHSWVLCFHFMQAVVGRVRHILDDSIEKCEFKSVDQLEDKKQKAEWVYTKVLNILAFGADAPGFSKSTLAVLVDFWYSLDYSLRMHNRNELGDRLEPPYGANNVLERFLAASCGFSNDFHHRIQVQTSEHLDSESIVKELINATEKGWELCHVHGQTYVVKSKDSKSDGWVRLPFTAEHVLRSTYRRG